MRGHEDDVERLLREIDDRRKALIEQIARGGVSVDNVAGGYRDLTGQVKGFDEAEALVREVMRPYLPEVLRPEVAPKPRGGDY